MHNKTVTILLLLTLATLVTAAGPPAEPPDLLEQAKQLADAGQYGQAEQLYQAILADEPGPDQALAAQKGLAILYVRSGQGAQAKQALEDLIAGFSDHWDVARAVAHVADARRETGKHSDALETYDRVIAAWPDDEHALWSQMGMAISHASLKDAKASDAAVEQLCTTWQGHHHLGRALCIVADNYRRLNTHEKARDIYNRALASNPDPEFEMWSRMGLAISSLHLGDYASANAAVEKMLEDSFEDERMAIVACLVADEYRARQAHQVACVLYQYVVDNWPQTEHAMWSQMGLAISTGALQGDDAAATAKLSASYSGEPQYPLALLQIGEIYYDQAFLKLRAELAEESLPYFREAITRWDKIITDYPASGAAVEAHYFTAVCHRYLHEYEQAITHYRTVVRKWPDCPYAWDSQFLVGYCYKQMRETGALHEDVADPQIRAAYEQLVNNYPDCPAARIAQRWLDARAQAE